MSKSQSPRAEPRLEVPFQRQGTSTEKVMASYVAKRTEQDILQSMAQGKVLK